MRRLANSLQKNPGEFTRHVLIALAEEGIAIDQRNERMIADHPEERAHQHYGICLSEGAFADALANIAAQQFIDWPHLAFHEQLGEFVPFQAAEQEKPQQSRLFPMGFQNLEGKRLENSGVVALIHGLSQLGEELLAVSLNNEVDDGCVEIFLGSEVAKNNGFADACSAGDFPRGRSLEASG